MKTPVPPSTPSVEEKAPLAYRSGVAARLAGLPVETLRVWERRYGLSDTPRSIRGQRLYSGEQVRRLGLLKQLVDQGHPIGMLASLPLARLEAMTGTPGTAPGQGGARLRVAVVGDNLARRIASDRRDGGALEVLRSCVGLEQAALWSAEELVQAPIDALLVEVAELDDGAIPQIFALRQRCGVAAVVVMYRFCASATIRALREHGCLVARVPAELGELVLLCRTALGGPGHGALAVAASPPQGTAPVTPRRFDDDALATFTMASSTLQCECPRHLADVLMMIGSFERYSAQCANRNLADAQLHLELEHAAGQARTILETALETLALAEGLALPR